MANIVLNSNYLEYLLSYLHSQGVSRIQALAGVSFLANKKPGQESKLPKDICDCDLKLILENATKALSVTAYQLGFELGRGMTSTSHGSLGLALICCNQLRTISFSI